MVSALCAVILGDTSDSRSLLVAARGADVVVHEATVTEHEADFAVDRGHSTACIEFLYFTWQTYLCIKIDSVFLSLTNAVSMPSFT